MSTFSGNEDGIYRILGKIYLSTYEPFSKSIDIFEKYEIRNILSVLRDPIPEKYTIHPYNHLQIEIDDEPTANILEHFQETNEFISTSLFGKVINQGEGKLNKHNDGIVIHCNAGCSRSVTVIIAFLMKFYGLSLMKSLYAIKRVKKDCSPNDGFIAELEFYESLNCLDDKLQLLKNPNYKQLVMGLFTERDDIMGIVSNEDMFTNSNRQEDDKGNDETKLRCKKCRHSLARSTSFIPHTPPNDDEESDAKHGYFIKTAYKSRRIVDIQKGSNECTHFFVEPLDWMQPELTKGDIEGKFSCPKCETKVGGYSWKGSRCSCGRWSIPAIHLQKAKCDEFKTKPIALPNKVVHSTSNNV